MMLRVLALAASICSASSSPGPTADNVLDRIYREHFPRGRVLDEGADQTIDELEKENPPQNSSERRILDDLEGMSRFQKYLTRHKQFLEGEAGRYKDLHERAEINLRVSLQRKQRDLQQLQKRVGNLKRPPTPPKAISLGQQSAAAPEEEEDSAVPRELIDADRSLLELHADANPPLLLGHNRGSQTPGDLAAEVKELQRRLTADARGHPIRGAPLESRDNLDPVVVKAKHLEDLERPIPAKKWKWPFYMTDPSLLEIGNSPSTGSSADVRSRVQQNFTASAVGVSEQIDRSRHQEAEFRRKRADLVERVNGLAKTVTERPSKGELRQFLLTHRK